MQYTDDQTGNITHLVIHKDNIINIILTLAEYKYSRAKKQNCLQHF